MIEQTVTVTNRLGLHARAAATLVRTASRFSSDLALARPGSDTPADAKSILNVLMLSASQGTALHLSANGPDETAALATVAALFAQGFGEEEHIVVRARTRGPRPTMTRQGLSVSPGIVVGRVMRLFQGTPQVFRSVLATTEIDHEIHRLRAAVRLARRQLSAIKTRASQEFGEEHAYIFDAHLLMVSDHKLLDDIENFIRREMVNAEWAVKVASDRIIALYAEMDDVYLRERGTDVEDVTQRILHILSGERGVARRAEESAVIVAEDLLPSALAELDLSRTRAIVLDAGGWTSHTSIIARALGIPAVVGVRNLHQRARTGDLIIVDAYNGTAVLHPTPATVRYYEEKAVQRAPAIRPADEIPQTCHTLDGVEIILRANIELPAEYQGVKNYGARGIGLYRSEFLLTHHKTLPDEEEQRVAYVELAQLGGTDGTTIRLFDLGGDKIGGGCPEAERNPALGLRAIRLALKRQDLLRTQARAILRAAVAGKLDIVLPMVADVADVRRTRHIIEEERHNLERDGYAVGPVRLGAMIELPSAVILAHQLAREVDFFSLGTNDLVQYTLGVDRGNEAVADWFRTLHPAVLHSIARTLEAARDAGIPAVVCGEMAATPTYAVILLGLGARQLSMMPAALPRMRHVLSSLSVADARAIAARTLECATADDSEHIVASELMARWPQFFGPHNLPLPAVR